MPSGSLYQIPDFLAPTLNQQRYEKWLQGRARAHHRRDKKRGNPSATNAEYKRAIHSAVTTSDGRDYYTGESLDWSLLGRYDNAESRAGRREYKATFALLPTVDHVDDGLGPANFKVCAWRTNDAKSDLTQAQFVALCRRVVNHSSR